MNTSPSKLDLSYIARNEILKCVPQEPGAMALIEDAISSMPELVSIDEETLKKYLIENQAFLDMLSSSIVSLREGRISVRNFGESVKRVLNCLTYRSGEKNKEGLKEIIQYIKQLQDDVAWKVKRAREGKYTEHDFGASQDDINTFHGQPKEKVYKTLEEWTNQNYRKDTSLHGILSYLLSKKGAGIVLDELDRAFPSLGRKAISATLGQWRRKSTAVPFKDTSPYAGHYQLKPSQIRVPAEKA